MKSYRNLAFPPTLASGHIPRILCIRTWLVRSGSDAACFSGKFVVSSAGEAYDARNRAPNREFQLNALILKEQ